MGRQRFPISDFLANFSLFRGLDGEAIGRLAAGSNELDASRGTIVYRRGQPGAGMHIVVYGQVKLSLHIGDGDERVIGLVDPGSSFGEAPMFLAKPYLTTAEAIVDSKLLLVGKEALLAEVRRDAGFSHTIIANLSAKLYAQMQNLEICTLSSGMRRVIRYLLHNGPVDTVGAALHITLPTKKWIIASRLNLTQEHFSRILHALMRDDLIEVDGREVRIPDPVRLRALVAD